MLKPATAAVLLSDVHLCETRPAQVERFLSVLAGPAREAGALYILGDLFEYWVGDDDAESALPNRIVDALQALSASDCEVFYLHGNRDFLIGEAFARRAGLTLLPDPVCLDLFGVPTILMHGDLLCTDDTDYQAFRAQVRNPVWQSRFLAQALSVRHEQAQGATAESGRAKQRKSEAIMDVNEQAVQALFRQFPGARLIHGHTHRPGHHHHLVDGHDYERWVLPDWYGPGGYLQVDGMGIRAVSFSAS